MENTEITKELLDKIVSELLDEQANEIYVEKLTLFQKLQGHIGEKFYSPILNTYVTLVELYNDYYIKIITDNNNSIILTENGIWLDDTKEQLFIYPDKTNNDWNKWYIKNHKRLNININLNINLYKKDSLDPLIVKTAIYNNIKNLLPILSDEPWRIIDKKIYANIN